VIKHLRRQSPAGSSPADGGKPLAGPLTREAAEAFIAGGRTGWFYAVVANAMAEAED
jgi:hypothetical protein